MRAETFLDGRVTLQSGDCLDVLAGMDEGSVDSVVCDPPYHLTSIVKRFGKPGAAEAKGGKSGVYKRASRGFMGKEWDGGDIAFRPETWAAVMRVMKPGAHLVAFGAPKNFGYMQVAMADAGLECRDVLAWIFGSGFPKSHNLKGEWEGWGTALKPAYEPILLCRKPLIGTVAENVLEHGTGAINVDGCRIHAEDAQGGEYTVKRLKPGATLDKTEGNWRPEDGPEYHGTMKPGRWPANIVHDGSEEVLAAFPEAPGQQGDLRSTNARPSKTCFGDMAAPLPHAARLDSGSAARFFYTAKADAEDRLGSKHPTVKPVDLMQWLVRLVTPKGGLVLDPFAGTGTTGEAAWREGMRAVLVEREEEYQADIRRRMKLANAGPTERRAAMTKQDPLPMDGLFAGVDAAE